MHPLKIMVWTEISKKGATNVCLLNCSVNSSVYQEVLRTHLLLFLHEHLPDGQLQQDNAPCHVFKATQKFLTDNKVPLFQTPPESPNCDPIKNVWHELKHFIRTMVMDAPKQGRADARDLDILGNTYTKEMLQVHRPFAEGHPQSFGSERRSYRILTCAC